MRLFDVADNVLKRLVSIKLLGIAGQHGNGGAFVRIVRNVSHRVHRTRKISEYTRRGCQNAT